jgi:hypothetical protein
MVKKGTPCLPLCFRIRARQSAEASQHRDLVQGDVIGLVALDFILRLVRCSMVDVAFVIDVPSMDFDDFSAHPPGFRIPAHVIANLERLDHSSAARLFESLERVQKLALMHFAESGLLFGVLKQQQELAEELKEAQAKEREVAK